MQPVSLAATRYDATTIVFHWAVAALVAIQWFGAQIIDWFPSGPSRIDARSVHIAGGVLLALILLGRIVWRLTAGRRLPSAEGGIVGLIAKAAHCGLYGLLVLMVMLGMALAWARGDSIFNLFSLPPIDPGNKALSHQIGGLHGTIGWLIVALVGLHATAALWHHYVRGDGVLRRMLPFGQRGRTRPVG
jgi:cytochrome b561